MIVLKKFLQRLTTSQEDLDAAALKAFCRNRPDMTPIEELVPRAEATVVGEISSLRIVPHDGSPWLEATITDGTARWWPCGRGDGRSPASSQGDAWRSRAAGDDDRRPAAADLQPDLRAALTPPSGPRAPGPRRPATVVTAQPRWLSSTSSEPS